ncbi:Glycoside hydrolase [Mycena venus]|uniref:glucan endo-1,3-beta-D-glucosidase n=1 Tax=Mycena venus TaxID=2733690 RepID=A0A8H6XA60_9AGAR|nr:Glycoside hydrolase [Mycena venus]
MQYQNSAHYHGTDPQHSQPDLHQHYDVPNGTGTDATQDIPMIPQKYGAYAYCPADSQIEIVGRDHYPTSVRSAIQPSPNDAWREKSSSGTTRSNLKWMATQIIGVLVLLGLLGAGAAAAMLLAKKNFASASSASSASTPKSDSDSGSDPSSFVKDPALVQSFYGIAYTPQGSQLPDCGNSLDNVIKDIQLLSQLTTRIRLYGADCNQTELVLEAITQTKVNMTVWLGNYAVATDNGAAYARQRDTIKAAIQKYGVEHIGGLTVGNEFILNYLDANNAADPNGPVGNTGAAILIANIHDSKSMTRDLSLGNIAVGTSDAGSYFNTKVLEAVDYGMANVHPWFAKTLIQEAAGWTAEFFSDTDLKAAGAVSNTPQMYIAETGWPTDSFDASSATNGASAASEANLQIFLDTFVCQANKNGTKSSSFCSNTASADPLEY